MSTCQPTSHWFIGHGTHTSSVGATALEGGGAAEGCAGRIGRPAAFCEGRQMPRPLCVGRNLAQTPFTNHHRHSPLPHSMMQWRSYRTRRRARPILDWDRSSETTPPMGLILENCRLKLFLHLLRAPQKDSANRKIHHAEALWKVRYSAKEWQRELWRRPRSSGKHAGLSSRQWRMLNIFRPPTTRSSGVMRVKLSLDRVE
jgi:hypothetical protein